jgi:uncharacterized Zn finger protein
VETQVIARLERAYPELFSQVSWSRDQQEKFLAWCLEVAKKRVEAIVGGQHRNSYDKAAVLAAACVEVLRQRGNNREADAFLNGIRTRFPRHRAFQAELNEAVRRSA